MLKGTMASDSPQCDSSALQRNYAFGQKHRIRGTPGLVFEDGRTQAGRDEHRADREAARRDQGEDARLTAPRAASYSR